VIGVPDGYRGESVKALVVPRAGISVQPAEIIDWARGQMAAFKVPRVVQLVEQLPKTATGKILWRELQEKERSK
jgi:fatty-acyl-CoA synthase